MLRNGLEKDYIFCLSFAKMDQKTSPKAFRFGHLLTQDMIPLGNVERHKEDGHIVLKEVVAPSPQQLKFPVCNILGQAEVFLSLLLN